MSNLSAANIYVDNTLSSDCTSGNYSISNRDGNGSDGIAYNTIQEAVNAVAAGDTIFMRQGIYREHINIPGGKQGNNQAWITLRSYPGEWAVIDSGHSDGSGYDAYVIRYKGGSYSSCPAYWKFSNFEVTGGGINTSSTHGGGFVFDTGHHLIFEYLYVHANYCNNSNNGSGIGIFNDGGQTGKNIIIRYCWLKDNACQTGDNCSNIVFMSTYQSDPSSVNINYARQKNEVKYNLIEGSNHGIKSKGPTAFLSLDNSGTHTTYKEYGDKIHHNIVRDFNYTGIIGFQDFIQIYNNIVDNSNAKRGINLGYYHGYPREPFFACAYNNLLLNTNLISGIPREHSSYSPPLHPFLYLYNNIIEDYGPETNSHNDMNIFFVWDQYSIGDLDLRTVFVENNLITGKTSSEESINIVQNSYDRSIDWFKASGYSSVFYNTTSSSGLHKTGSNYKCNSFYSIDGDKTIGNGGVGGPHPYLSQVTLPSYLGAADPEDDAWIDGTLGLATMSAGIPINLRDGSGDPNWIEGGGGTPPHHPPSAPSGLTIIE
jgi:hypothetical protein